MEEVSKLLVWAMSKSVTKWLPSATRILWHPRSRSLSAGGGNLCGQLQMGPTVAAKFS